MQARTIAALGVAAWLAAAAPAALAADESDKPQAKDAPVSAPASEAKPDTDAKAVKPAGPRLRMGEHRGKNPGGDRDVRHCLDLPTSQEVIRCYERK